MAEKEDWIKIDSKGYPYPNKRKYFEENYRYVKDDIYEQLPKPLRAWTADCEMCAEVMFLINEKGLIINKDSYERFYSANLWATLEVANKVGYSRRNAFVPVPTITSFDEYNDGLFDWCEKDAQRDHYKHKVPI